MAIKLYKFSCETNRVSYLDPQLLWNSYFEWWKKGFMQIFHPHNYWFIQHYSWIYQRWIFLWPIWGIEIMIYSNKDILRKKLQKFKKWLRFMQRNVCYLSPKRVDIHYVKLWIFSIALWGATMNEVHPSLLKGNFCLFFNNATFAVIWCCLIIIQGFERIYVGMERKIGTCKKWRCDVYILLMPWFI